MHRPVVLRVLAVAALLAAPARVAAQPIVSVRAETRIELRVRRGATVRVGATLRDDRGNSLADRQLTVRIAEPGGVQRGSETGTTDARGELEVTFEVEPGTYQFEARYAGDESYDDTRVELLLDLERAHVRLLMSPVEGRLDRLDLDVPTHRLRVRAESDAGGGGLEVRLENELEELLASGTTAEDGSVVLEVASAALGSPAAGRMIVKTSGDAQRAPAQTEVLVVRFRPTALTLTTTAARVEAGQPVRVEGQLRTSERPLARKAVGIYAGDRHLETVLTDGEGRFAREIVLEDNEGTVALTARFEGDAPWRPAASSEPVEVRIEPRGATPARWLLVPIALSALLLGLLWWRGRRKDASAEAPRSSHVPAPPGIHVATEAAASPRAGRRDVAGIALDADEGEPIAGARVELTGPGEPLSAVSDDAGAFAIAEVPDGRWTIRVEHASYESREAIVDVPHRGALAALQVRLRSLRQVALRKYAPLAEALVPQRRWWAFWTPRELADRARASVRGDVEEVTRAVEEVVWSAGPPAPDSVEEIGRRASELASEVREDSSAR
ncbi:MAG: carboxypeptidase regulatory-like domain-containing protein [Sandaracinaceae bacterium]|nr:carboxypeptidase regulatory-like domain-containing protein [Sandaracinaceae bacterium]